MEDRKDHVKFPPNDFVPVGDILNGMKMGMGYKEDENVKEMPINNLKLLIGNFF